MFDDVCLQPRRPGVTQTMSPTWQDEYLDEIRKLDMSQPTHGLYGLREAMADGRKAFPSLAKILGDKDPRTGIASRLGWGAGRADHEFLVFRTPKGDFAGILLKSHASTKIRHYGDSYVLDRIHGKKVDENADLLESAVPSVRKKGKMLPAATVHGLLFIAHVPTSQRFTRLLGKTADSAFLDRYGLALHTRQWEDIYGRGFHTGLFLWTTKEEAPGQI